LLVGFIDSGFEQFQRVPNYIAPHLSMRDFEVKRIGDLQSVASDQLLITDY
jgi:hypothetical protein